MGYRNTVDLSKELIDVVRAQADLCVMLPAHRYVVVDIEKPVRFAFFIQPDQRALYDEEDLHRVLVLICHQRVSLAWRFIDEVAGRGGPVMLQIAPLTRNGVSKD